MKQLSFGDHLTRFLSIYLSVHQGRSENTILSYRDTFVLFLRFIRDCKGIKVENITFDNIDKRTVDEFLSWIEIDNGVSVSTRNQRLAAIKSFFRYLQSEAPEYLALCQHIASIETKTKKKPMISFLSKAGIKILLSQPDLSTASGRRDLAMLETLYDSGARVQELCDIKCSDVRLAPAGVLKLTGKGGKTRLVPLTTSTVALLRQYMAENKLDTSLAGDKPLFPNRYGQHISRSGIRYLLGKYVERATIAAPEEIPDTISPHSLRHSKAMHLLQSGSNLVYIRDVLGHEDIETTQVYAKADPEIKRKAITTAYADELPNQMPSWTDTPGLMARLTAMGKM